MQKLILDTNIVVSALIQKSYPHYIVYECVLGGYVQLCLSKPLLDEYIDVLASPKFNKISDFKRNADIVLKELTNMAVFFEPAITLKLIKDANDNRLLELADESSADFLITGNSKDFYMPYYKCTQIVSPHDFWDMFSLRIF